jgi:hypothetical protein
MEALTPTTSFLLLSETLRERQAQDAQPLPNSQCTAYGHSRKGEGSRSFLLGGESVAATSGFGFRDSA